MDQHQRRPSRAGGVEGLSASGDVAAIPGDGEFHAVPSAGQRQSSASGQNVRFQQVLEEGHAVLEQQLAFLEASDQQVVWGWVEHQVGDHLVEVVMFYLQLMQRGPVFGNLFFGQHGRRNPQGCNAARRAGFADPTRRACQERRSIRRCVPARRPVP